MKHFVILRVTRVADGQLLRHVNVEYHVALAYLVRNEDNDLITITIGDVA